MPVSPTTTPTRKPAASTAPEVVATSPMAASRLTGRPAGSDAIRPVGRALTVGLRGNSPNSGIARRQPPNPSAKLPRFHRRPQAPPPGRGARHEHVPRERSDDGFNKQPPDPEQDRGPGRARRDRRPPGGRLRSRPRDGGGHHLVPRGDPGDVQPAHG